MEAQIQNLRYKDKTQLIEYLEGMVRDYRKETDQNKQRIIKLEMEIFFKELDIIDFEKTESKVQKLLNENRDSESYAFYQKMLKNFQYLINLEKQNINIYQFWTYLVSKRRLEAPLNAVMVISS